MRRGDFCSDRVNCTTSVYIKRFEDALSGLVQNPKCFVTEETPVFVSVEEKNATFRNALAKKNWVIIDHSAYGTVNQTRRDGKPMDAWWPPVLDQAILAGGRALIGTNTSTFSGVSQVRVKAWHGGCTLLI